MKDAEAGGGLAASMVVRGAVCGPGLEAEVELGAEGGLLGMSMDKEGGFVNVPDVRAGRLHWGAQWFGEKGVESPRDCVG